MSRALSQNQIEEKREKKRFTPKAASPAKGRGAGSTAKAHGIQCQERV